MPPARSHFRAASRGAPSGASAARGCPGGVRLQRPCQGALLARSPPAGPFYSPRCRGGAAAGACPRVPGITRAGGAGARAAGAAAAGRAALGGGGSAARGRPLGAGGHGPRCCRPPAPPPSAALRHGPAWAGRAPRPPLASVPPSGLQPSPPLLAAAPLRAPRAFSLCIKVGEEPAAGGRAALPHRARPGEAVPGGRRWWGAGGRTRPARRPQRGGSEAAVCAARGRSEGPLVGPARGARPWGPPGRGARSAPGEAGQSGPRPCGGEKMEAGRQRGAGRAGRGWRGRGGAGRCRRCRR